MRILSARISGFRNLADAEFTFSPRVNVVLGKNGEGKTNLLEALNYLALGRSHRGARNEDQIAFARDNLHVALEVEDDAGAVFACEFGLDRSGGRRFRIDGEPVRRRVDLVGRLSTVFFNPDSIRLVQGSPERRRHFVDRGMAEITPSHLAHLTAYQRALRQKTGLLRDLKRGLADRRRVREDLAAWNAELARHAVGTVGRQANIPGQDTAQVRRRASLVTQDVQLFQTTVRNNLALFDPSVTDGQLLEVLEGLGLSAWLTSRQPSRMCTRNSRAVFLSFFCFFLSRPAPWISR